jgi:hypothetical protein
MPGQKSAEPDRREQFQIEVFPPDLVGDRFEGHRARCSGIVDEHVDPAEIGDHHLVGAGDVRGPGDVADVVANLEAILGQQFPRRLQIRRAPRKDRDLGAGLGESPRHCDADPLAAARDDGDAILHGYVHSFLPLLLRVAAIDQFQAAAPRCTSLRPPCRKVSPPRRLSIAPASSGCGDKPQP